MEKKLTRCIPLLALLFIGCGANSVYINVIQGNYHSGRGLYQKAIVSYLRALESQKHTEWVEYNLGNAYYSLGETEAALAVWEHAGLSLNPRLRFHVAYNKGCLYYEQGKYREAYEEFRHALQLMPSAVDAKINLELSLRRMASGGESSQQARREPGGTADESQRILDYVRRREGTRWRASDSIDDFGGEDW